MHADWLLAHAECSAGSPSPSIAPRSAPAATKAVSDSALGVITRSCPCIQKCHDHLPAPEARYVKRRLVGLVPCVHVSARRHKLVDHGAGHLRARG
jgi:hypothetical protein